MSDGHHCELTSGSWWRPECRREDFVVVERVRGRQCICGRFEPSTRRPIPTDRERRGAAARAAGDVLVSLDEAIASAARAILAAFVRSPRRRRWEPFASDLVGRGHSLPTLEAALDSLCRARIVAIAEKSSGVLTESWNPASVSLEPGSIDGVCSALGIEQSSRRCRDLALVIGEALAAARSDCAVSLRIRSLLEAQCAVLSQGGSTELRLGDEVVVTPARWDFYEGVLRILAALLEHVAQNEDVPAESFAAHVLGRAKAFTRPRREAVTRLLGVGLAELKLVEREPEARFFGAVSWTIGSARSDARASDSWIGLPRSAIADATLTITCPQLLVVENLTVFEALARAFREGDSPAFVGLWGAGYLSSAKETFIRRAVENGIEEVGICADLDADGVLLAQDIHDVASSCGARAVPVAMDATLHRQARRHYPLAESRLQLLAARDALDPSFQGLAQEILRGGTGVEQETFLPAIIAAAREWTGQARRGSLLPRV